MITLTDAAALLGAGVIAGAEGTARDCSADKDAERQRP